MSKNNVRLGTQLHTKVDPRLNGDAGNVAFGFVTNIIGEDEDQTLNLRVVLDAGADIKRTKIKLVGEEPDPLDGDVPTDSSGVQQVAWFPKD